MAKSDYAATRTVRLSDTVSVELTFSQSGMSAEWDPVIPTRLSERQWRRYVNGRNACAADLARRINERILVADVDRKWRISGQTLIHPDGRIEKVTDFDPVRRVEKAPVS